MTLRVEGDEIRILTLDRPNHLNALNRDLWGRLCTAFKQAADDPEVKVVVVTGNGRGFTAGQDLSEMKDMVGEGGENLPAQMMKLLIDYPVPLISAVNGVAAGFGLGLVMHSDVVVMAASARLGAPFVSIGLAMDAGMSHLLAQRIGYTRAAHLLLTGGWLDSEEAVVAGLAIEAVDDDHLRETALGYASRIASNPVEALRATKRLLQQSRREAVSAALAREEETLFELSRGDAHRQAVEAFFNKQASRA